MPKGGRYANYFQIGRRASEIVVDFGQCVSDSEGPEFFIRIFTSPAHAKELSRVLAEALNEYEQEYGQILPLAGDDEP